MSKHLQRDLDAVKKRLLSMGAMVENATNMAIAALVDRRPELAYEVMQGDDTIDEIEIEIEEDCLKILALHQPVATDLRFVVSVMKVNNDLERMGDLAINIAERASYLSTHDPIGVPLDFNQMADQVRSMVKESLDSVVNMDTKLARRVCRQDDAVDEVNREMFVILQDQMRREPETIERAVHLLSTSRHLERIADLATNIAEDVIFMVDGEVVRHQNEDYARQMGVEDPFPRD